jgi:acyl-CoA dehydrogenase
VFHTTPRAAELEKVLRRRHRVRAAPVLEKLKQKARSLGLWNFFLAHEEEGHDPLTNSEYAPFAELSGWVRSTPRSAVRVSTPDVGASRPVRAANGCSRPATSSSSTWPR